MQTVHIDLEVAGHRKRLRIDVTVCDPIKSYEPGTVVMVDCANGIVDDSALSGDDNDTEVHPAIVIKRSVQDRTTICWLLGTSGDDIQLHKAKWPLGWKQPDVRVLDTVHETVISASITAHKTPDDMMVATRAYDSKTKKVAGVSYTEFMLGVK